MESIQSSIEKILNNPVAQGITTGIKALDDAIKGFHPGHVITIGAVSSMGKSSLMRSMALAAAKEVPVGIFPIEGGTFSTVEVMIYTLARVNYHKKGKLSKTEEQAIKAAKAELKKLKGIYVDEAAVSMYPSWLLEKGPKKDSIEQSMQAMHKKGVRIFFIDYLQLVNWSFKIESEALRIKELTGKLARISIDLQVPIILLSQLTKDVAKRNIVKGMDPTPEKTDIRDSGFIENDSFEILLLHRPEYYDKPKDLTLLTNCAEEAEIIVAKQRFGPTGKINVKFEPFCMRWSDINESSAKGTLF